MATSLREEGRPDDEIKSWEDGNPVGFEGYLPYPLVKKCYFLIRKLKF